MTQTIKATAWATLFALVLGGCETPTSKDEHNKAKAHWSNTRASMLYSLAIQQFEASELDKAEKTCIDALAMSPDNAPCLELAARIEIERGRLERAFRTLEQVVKLDPNRSDAHYLMGVVYERWQRYEQALACYEKAYETRRDNPAGLLAAAETLVKLDRADEAAARLEEKLDYFPNNAAIRVELGRLNMIRHEYARAVARFQEAVVLDAEDRASAELLALARCAAGHYAEAIGDFKALLADPVNAERDDLRLALGDCYMSTQRPAEARALFMAVVRRNENDVNAWIKLGQCAWIVEDNTRLLQATERVTSLAPDRYEGYMLRGMTDQRAQRFEAAIAQFELAAARAPRSPAPLLLKGVTLENMGDPAGAAEAYRAALKISPDDPRAAKLLAAVTAP